MVYDDTMQRTQVYLGREELLLLDRMADASGASRSELIRRAIRERYGEGRPGDRLASLRETAGAWSDRGITGESYVEELRGDLQSRFEALDLP